MRTSRTVALGLFVLLCVPVLASAARTSGTSSISVVESDLSYGERAHVTATTSVKPPKGRTLWIEVDCTQNGVKVYSHIGDRTYAANDGFPLVSTQPPAGANWAWDAGWDGSSSASCVAELFYFSGSSNYSGPHTTLATRSFDVAPS